MLHGFKRKAMPVRTSIFALVCFMGLVVTGCQTASKPDNFLRPPSLNERIAQTRIYPTDDQIKILNASGDLLLANGFQITVVEGRMSWISAYKWKRNAFRANIVIRNVQGRSGSVAVRVTFHYRQYKRPPFYNLHSKPIPYWSLVKDPSIYQEFFSQLSKAIYLEAQKL